MAAAVGSSVTTSEVFCCIIYYRGDAELAEMIRNLLSQIIVCKLHYVQYTKKMHETMKDEVGKASCVISVLTEKLLQDKSIVNLTKLAYDLCQVKEGFIPIVLRDKSEQLIYLDFLNDCKPIEISPTNFNQPICSSVNDLCSELCRRVAVNSALVQTQYLLQRSHGSAAAAPKSVEIGSGSFCSVKKIKVGNAVPLVDKILHDFSSQYNTVKYYDREQIMKNLRSPFLLPLLETNLNERHCMQEKGIFYKLVLTVPWMSGNLEELLKRGTSGKKLGDSDIDLDRVSHVKQRLRIAYQLSAAVDFIHSHDIQHGDIKPKYILLDDCMNARLSGFGHAASNVTDSKMLETDIFYCGKTLLSMMILEKGRSCFNALFEKFEPIKIKEYIKNYVTSVWPRTITEAMTNCLVSDERMSASELKDEVNAAMEKVRGIARYTCPETQEQQCVYCVVGKPRSNMLVQSANCQQDCVFLKMCPSCMTTYGRSPVTGKYVQQYLEICRCPSDDSPIYPAIGGPRAFALLIAGSDTNEKIQATFSRDTQLMSAVIQHPRVMGIPDKNIFYITPGCLKDTKNENRKPFTRQGFEVLVESIEALNPDFFFLYYTGHEDIKELQFPVSEQASDYDGDDVSDFTDSEDPLLAKHIRQKLCRLAMKCPRILVIIDCCEAASISLNSLLDADSCDEHVRYHVQWSSCGRKQESKFTIGKCSEFTAYLLSGLSGARTCPFSDNDHRTTSSRTDCEICVDFRDDCSSSQCVTLNSLRTFVDRHMAQKQSYEKNENKRRSITSTDCREDPCIAYFTGKPLFSIIYESPDGKINIFSTNNVDGNGVGLRQELWNKIKDCLPLNMPEEVLRIRKRICTEYITVEFKDMLTLSDTELLHVSVITDGNEISVSRHVACMYNGPQAETILRDMTSNAPDCDNNLKRWKIEAANIGLLKFNRSRKSTTDEITATVISCREVLQNLGKGRNLIKLYCLVIDVFANVTIFSIAEESAESHPCQPNTINDSQLSNQYQEVSNDFPSCPADSAYGTGIN